MRRQSQVRWLLTAAAAAVVACTVLPAAPAGAQTYPGCTAELDKVSVDPGDSIVVTGTNAQPSEDVGASIEGKVIGSGVADSDGDFSFRATVPASLEAGTHPVQVSCGPRGALLTVRVTVGPVAPPTGQLPRTGSGNTILLTQIAVLLIAVGGLVALTSRRRRTAERGDQISA